MFGSIILLIVSNICPGRGHASSVMRRLGAIATSCLRHSGDVSDTDPHRKDPCVHVIENGFPFFNWFSEKPVSPEKPKPSKQTTRRIRLGRLLGVLQRSAVQGWSSSLVLAVTNTATRQVLGIHTQGLDGQDLGHRRPIGRLLAGSAPKRGPVNDYKPGGGTRPERSCSAPPRRLG